MRSEFQFISQIKARFSLEIVGDDCAVLPKNENQDLLMTADLLLEEVDFRLQWADARSIGYKALAVSLSDIAAMGGDPKWAFLSIGVPEILWDGEFLDRLYEGWHEVAAKFGVKMAGGDVSRSKQGLCIDSIVLGEVDRGKAILRSGARAGDALYVSGNLGRCAAGLKILEGVGSSQVDTAAKARVVQKLLRPEPQIELAKSLQRLGFITSMVDISDGLSSDIYQICEASGVGAEIDEKAVPIDDAVRSLFPDQYSDLALNGGEEFELLFTVSAVAEKHLSGLPVTRIGSITDSAGTIKTYKNGTEEILRPKGFSHF